MCDEQWFSKSIWDVWGVAVPLLNALSQCRAVSDNLLIMIKFHVRHIWITLIVQCNFCPQYLQCESGQIGILMKLTPKFVAADRWQQPAKEQKCVEEMCCCCLSETSRGRKWIWEKRKCATYTQQSEMRCPRVCMEVPLRRNYTVYTLSPNINSVFPTVSAKAPGLYCTILERPRGGKRLTVSFLLCTPPDHAHYVSGSLDLLLLWYILSHPNINAGSRAVQCCFQW